MTSKLCLNHGTNQSLANEKKYRFSPPFPVGTLKRNQTLKFQIVSSWTQWRYADFYKKTHLTSLFVRLWRKVFDETRIEILLSEGRIRRPDSCIGGSVSCPIRWNGLVAERMRWPRWVTGSGKHF